MRLLKFGGSVAFLTFLTSCGTSQTYSPQIIGGQETNAYPAVVMVNGGMCTGTFIRHNVLLTAGHCLSRTGGIEANGQYAIDVVRHPDYDSGPNHDIALALFPDYTSSYTINVASSSASRGDRVAMVGYGDTNGGGPGGVLRVAFNTISTTLFSRITVTSIGGGGLTFNGDSGGPLIADGKGIVGVTSEGAPPVSVFTDLTISSNKSFIQNTLSRMGASISNPNPIPNPDDTNPTPNITSDFNFRGVLNGNLHQLEFFYIPVESGAYEVRIFAENSPTPIAREYVNNRTSFITAQSMNLEGVDLLTVRIYDNRGKVIAERSKNR